MYGLPDDSALAAVVHDLVAAHPHQVGDVQGIEPALLATLQRAIGSDQGRGSVSGVSGASGVLNLGALQLWDEISRTVAEHWPGRGQLALAGAPLIQRLVAWTEALAGTTQEVHLLEMCVYWRHQIRELLEPPKRVALRGVPCPECGNAELLSTDLDGGTVRSPALLVHLSAQPVRAECLVCTHEWEGGQLVDLGTVPA